jgi:hypothetical protein
MRRTLCSFGLWRDTARTPTEFQLAWLVGFPDCAMFDEFANAIQSREPMSREQLCPPARRL